MVTLKTIRSWLNAPVGINLINHWSHDANYCSCIILGVEAKRYDGYGINRGIFFEITLLNFGIEFYIAKRIEYADMFGLPDNGGQWPAEVIDKIVKNKVMAGGKSNIPNAMCMKTDPEGDEVACPPITVHEGS